MDRTSQQDGGRSPPSQILETHPRDSTAIYNAPIDNMVSGLTRAFWVWNSVDIIGNAQQTNDLITSSQALNISDLYLYMNPSWYSPKTEGLQALITAATDAGQRVWGLDGDRGYLADGSGPQPLYTGIQNLITYNENVPAAAQFHGFQTDIEPQDSGTYTTFHNGIGDASLNTSAGSGVWKRTQAQDREMLLRSWLAIHQKAGQMLHNAGLELSSAQPFWTENYYGGQIQVSFPGSTNTRQGVMQYMMTLVDEYVIMSYNTYPANAASRVAAQAEYASNNMTADARPRVYGSLETEQGAGVDVSYGDTAGKDSKAVVLQDMGTIEGTLSQYEAFKGMVIHHWASWQVMPA